MQCYAYCAVVHLYIFVHFCKIKKIETPQISTFISPLILFAQIYVQEFALLLKIPCGGKVEKYHPGQKWHKSVFYCFTRRTDPPYSSVPIERHEITRSAVYPLKSTLRTYAIRGSSQKERHLLKKTSHDFELHTTRKHQRTDILLRYKHMTTTFLKM